jgi:hypothetical protein
LCQFHYMLALTYSTVRAVEKRLVCNRKGPICKDRRLRLILYDWFFSCRTVVFKSRMGSISVLTKM